MEQNLETKLEFKQKLLNFYNNNKIKIYFFLAMLVVGSLLAIYLIHDNEKKKKFNC